MYVCVCVEIGLKKGRKTVEQSREVEKRIDRE